MQQQLTSRLSSPCTSFTTPAASMLPKPHHTTPHDATGCIDGQALGVGPRRLRRHSLSHQRLPQHAAPEADRGARQRFRDHGPGWSSRWVHIARHHTGWGQGRLPACAASLLCSKRGIKGAAHARGPIIILYTSLRLSCPIWCPLASLSNRQNLPVTLYQNLPSTPYAPCPRTRPIVRPGRFPRQHQGSGQHGSEPRGPGCGKGHSPADWVRGRRLWSHRPGGCCCVSRARLKTAFAPSLAPLCPSSGLV